MIDFTHKKRPEFIQLVLIIAVVCLALGSITPAASAVEYENLTYSLGDPVSGSGSLSLTTSYTQFGSVPLSDGSQLEIRTYYDGGMDGYGPLSISNMSIIADYEILPWSSIYGFPLAERSAIFVLNGANGYYCLDKILEFITLYTNIDNNELCVYTYQSGVGYLLVYNLSHMSELTWDYLYSGDSLDLSLTAFAPENPSGMYVLSLDGSLLDTTYTVGVNRYTDEFRYLIDSYAYTDGSGSYTFTGSRSLSLPIYYNSFTNMPYSYEVSVNVNDENGYLDTRYLVYWSDLGGLYDTVPEPLLPTPTPTVTFVPPGLPDIPNIIPDPAGLNDTVNFTGWYQDQGFEGNNITAPIYSGLRGWFNDNMIPVFDFFLMPIGSLSSMITESASTSTDAISDSVNQLSIYAAPMNMVGGYVVLLVPAVVWVVVFAALSIGYVVLLIRISTGSIRDTIGRFLGRW